MNVMMIKNIVGRTGLVLQKYSPQILTGLGIVSGVGSTVLACKATLKLEDTLEKAEKRIKAVPAEDQKELTKAYIRNGAEIAKLYAPAASLGVLSITCALGGQKIMHSRNVALAAAYKLAEEAFTEYRHRVIDAYGEDTDRMFKYGLKKETVTVVEEGEDGKKKKVKRDIDVPIDPSKISQYARFFDEGCKNWDKNPEYNMFFLKSSQNYMNDLLRSRGHVFLNEVYEHLGLPHSQAGAVVGWVMSKDGDNFIDYGLYDDTIEKTRDFVNGYENVILLDFNVDGVIWNLI